MPFDSAPRRSPRPRPSTRPRARASAYWNASVMQANRGDITAAVPLAERALALLGEGQDARNLARLRAEVGRLQLELEPPAVDDARSNLQQAVTEMEWSSATPMDRAWTLLGLARAAFLSDDLRRVPPPARGRPRHVRRPGTAGRGRGARPRRPHQCRRRRTPDEAARCYQAGGAASCRASAPTRARRSCGSTSRLSWRASDLVEAATRRLPSRRSLDRPPCSHDRPTRSAR